MGDVTSAGSGDEVTVGGTGRDAAGANDAELSAAGWRLNVSGDFGDACLTVPHMPLAEMDDVTEGVCR